MRTRAVSALALACLAFSPLPARTADNATSKDIEAKVSLESALEKRLQSVLRAVLGTEDLIVIVNVDLLPETERAEAEVMPGVPPRQTPAIPGALGLTLNTVRRVSATVLIPQSTGDNELRLVKQIAGNILGISGERGDLLIVDKMRFQKPAYGLKPEELLRLPLTSSLVWLLIAAAALLFLNSRFLSPFLTLLRELGMAARQARTPEKVPEIEGPEGEAPDQAPAGLPAALANGQGPARPDMPFAFITEHDLSRLVFLLRQEKALAAATIIHYLPPACASQALSALDGEVRREVVTLMSQVTQQEEGRVRSLEESLKKRIDYLTGGEDKLVEILDSLPTGLQTEMLETLRQQDEGLAERLSQRLVFLEDLAALEPGELKILSRRIPVRVLADVLKASPALKDNLLPKLAAGMRAWLTQEIELSPELAPAALEAGRRRVLGAFTALVREGRIPLRKFKRSTWT